MTPELRAYLLEHKENIIERVLQNEYERWKAERPAAGGDPRPDLEKDGIIWAHLLAAAYELDGQDPTGAWAALHVVRCLGAVIVSQGGYWKLSPGPEYAPREWTDHRARYLAPRTETIKRLLAQVAEKPALVASRNAASLQKGTKVSESGEPEASCTAPSLFNMKEAAA